MTLSFPVSNIFFYFFFFLYYTGVVAQKRATMGRFRGIYRKGCFEMKTQKKSFLIYHDNCDWLEGLNYEELGRLFSALYRYADYIRTDLITPMTYLEQVGVDATGVVLYLFGFMADNIYRDTMKWNVIVDKRLQRLELERAEKT